MLIAAHGNSLRALVKYLDNISEQDIVELNIPTGIPLVYELDENLKPLGKPLSGRSGGGEARGGSRRATGSSRARHTMDVDVFIAGGGLAGLTLARQLRRTDPTLRIAVAEKRRHPAPEAAHKVGESSVEIGAHYFEKVLDLESHLRSGHLEKLGLRYFFPQRRQS